MGVANIRAAFNFDSQLVPQLAVELFLNADVRVSGKEDDNRAACGVPNDDGAGVLLLYVNL